MITILGTSKTTGRSGHPAFYSTNLYNNFYFLQQYIYIYIGSRRSHIQNCLGAPRIRIHHCFFILRSYSQNLGTDFFSAAAAATTATTNRFSEFSLGRKSSVIRCKRDGKSRRVRTTSLWFEIGALHQITSFLNIIINIP